MGKLPDSELWELLKSFQSGDSHAIWLFVENEKIKAIIRGRLNQYRQMFRYLPQEDLDDIEFGVIPRIREIALMFKLPVQKNDGRIIAYFNLRLRGEMDFILKKVTNMKLVADEERGKTYLKSFAQPLEGMEENLQKDGEFVEELIDGIEIRRQDDLLSDVLDHIPKESSDRIWLRCYLLRIKGSTWAEIGKEIGFKQTDYAWLNLNTARFLTRLKHRLISMGEKVNYRVCGIYTDDSEVAISIYDSSDKKKNIIWSKTYESYADLDKIEAKIGDIFRQYDITYVVMNECAVENRAFVIIMRYLSKRESFVETVEYRLFRTLLESMPSVVNGVTALPSQKIALLLTNIKRAWIDETKHN